MSYPGPAIYIPHVLDVDPTVVWSPSTSVATWTLSGGALQATAVAVSRDGGNSWTRPVALRREIDTHVDQIHGRQSAHVESDGDWVIATIYSRQDSGQTVALYEVEAGDEDMAEVLPEFAFPFLRRADSEFISLRYPIIVRDESSSDTHVGFCQRFSNSQILSVVSRRDGFWSTISEISGDQCLDGRIQLGPEGELFAIWHDLRSRQMLFRRSDDRGVTFAPEVVVGPVVANFSEPPRIDAVVPTLNQVYCTGRLTLTTPELAVDRSHGPRRGWIYVVWPERVFGSLDPIVDTIREIEPNESGETATQVRYGQSFTGAAISPDLSSDADVFYFQGKRGDIVQMSGKLTSYSPASPFPLCGDRFSLTGFRGPALASEGSVAHGWIDFGLAVNPPLLTMLPLDGDYLTVFAASDRHSLSYRVDVQRMIPDPTSVARDQRDVVVAVSRDGGRTWVPKRLVNDDAPRFDNYLPTVAVDELGRVHVAWYDRRDDVEAGLDYHVYTTMSKDGGVTFEPSVPLSQTQSAVGIGKVNRLGTRMGLAGTADGVIGAWTFATQTPVNDALTEHDIYVRRLEVPTAAAVSGLHVESRVGEAALRWRIEEPEVLWRFVVRRRVAGTGAGFDSVDSVARGVDAATLEYGYRDPTVQDGTTYEYRVDMVLANGWARESTVVSTAVPARPLTLGLRLVSSGGRELPVRLEVSSPEAGEGILRVFDVTGTLVRSLAGLRVEVGTNLVEWNGTSETGAIAAAGVYFIEMRLAGRRASIKVNRAR